MCRTKMKENTHLPRGSTDCEWNIFTNNIITNGLPQAVQSNCFLSGHDVFLGGSCSSCNGQMFAHRAIKRTCLKRAAMSSRNQCKYGQNLHSGSLPRLSANLHPFFYPDFSFVYHFLALLSLSFS